MTEEKQLATWGTDIPEDLVLDQEKLALSLKKVNLSCTNPYDRDLRNDVSTPMEASTTQISLVCVLELQFQGWNFLWCVQKHIFT